LTSTLSKLADRLRRRAGVTLLELVVVMAVLAALAAVTVPALGRGGSHATVLRGAQRLATALRFAQASAQDGECRTRLRLLGVSTLVVERRRDGVWTCESQTGLGAVTCATNYPAAAVEFDAAGYPLATTSGAPRAGTFTVGHGDDERAVVIQLTGRIRVR
jgi:prepilin-type N-terminal cleavage/methylation domain-containing protein